MRKKRPDNTLELLISILLLIPISAYFFMKAIFYATLKICALLDRRNHTPDQEPSCLYNTSTKPKVKEPRVDMKNIDSMSGITFENFVARLLSENGYEKVETTKVSGDYGVDIVAFKHEEKHAFQCKCYSSNLGIKPIQEVYSGAGMYHAKIAVVVTNSYFTANAKELANKLGVLLWDRDKLTRLIKDNGANQPEKQFHLKNSKKENKFVLVSEQGEQEMATVLKAGKYIFGKNIPNGVYDLTVINGNGSLTLFYRDKDRDDEWLSLGDGTYSCNAKEFKGIDSDEIKRFEIDGSVEVKISRAKMIMTED